MSNTLETEINARRQKVLEGINIILSLFSTVKQQRTISKKNNDQEN